jgi:hypothetical protein
VRVWTVERQLTYRVEAESREDALALSYLVDSVDEISTVWEDLEWEETL